MRLEHHLVGGYVRYISPHIIIIIKKQHRSLIIHVSFNIVSMQNMQSYTKDSFPSTSQVYCRHV